MYLEEKNRNEISKIPKTFPETYIPFKSYKEYKKSKHNSRKKNIHEKIDSYERYTRQSPSDIKKLKKMNSYDKKINAAKHNFQYHHKRSHLTKNFHGKSLFYKNACNKSQDKSIKINLASQAFKIADDFNEKNSNQFLNEKDECLKEVILSDEIEDEEFIHFRAENEEKNIFNLSANKKNKINDNLNNKRIKRKIVKANLIEDHK